MTISDLQPLNRLTIDGSPARTVADAMAVHTGYDEIHCDDLAIRGLDALNEAGGVITGHSHQEVDAEVEACWTDFWLPLVAPDGVVDLAQIKRELFDYHTFMGNAAEVYCHVTDGLISKINTDASAVIGVANECLHMRVEEALEEELVFSDAELTTIARALRNAAQGIGSYPVACLELLHKIDQNTCVAPAQAESSDG